MDHSDSLSNVSIDDLQFRINNTVVDVVEKDIREVVADAVVSSDDTTLSMSGGVSRAIREQAGDRIEFELQKQHRLLNKRPLQRGDVVVTGAGDWQARYILHAVTLDYFQPSATQNLLLESELISYLITRILNIASALNIESIAIPLLGTGTADLGKDLVFELILKNTLYHLASREIPLQKISLVLRNPRDSFNNLVQELDKLSSEAENIQRKMDAIRSLQAEFDAQDRFNATLNQRVEMLQNELRDLFYLESTKLEGGTDWKSAYAIDLKALRNLLDERFNDDELRELCFQLSVDYEELPGTTKSYKTRELLSYLRRRDRLDDLITTIKELRTDIDLV